MSSSSQKWSDLGPRVLSAAVMVGIGVVGVLVGGPVFFALIAAICAAMVWELYRMLAPEAASQAVVFSLVAGLGLFAASFLPPLYAVPILGGAVMVGWGQVERLRFVYLSYAFCILLAGWGLIYVYESYGQAYIVWFVAVVVATDVGGYAAGRLLGGPKFWPSISPKKTWSGILAGWSAAAACGLAFDIFLEQKLEAFFVSIALSFASQLGDIAESAIKRNVGVKDSSNLIPGHGGLLDRFDGFVGAALGLFITVLFFDFPW